MKIESFQKLVTSLHQIPGIGQKTAEKLSYSILSKDKNYIDELTFALEEVKNKISLCQECFAFTETPICSICTSDQRTAQTLCVIKDPIHLFSIEKSRTYTGKYHVLHGCLSPMKGVYPENLKIEELQARIEKEDIKEVILALDSQFEGEATSLYLHDLLKDTVSITKLGHGLPMGSSLDFVDERTLSMAFKYRTDLSI